MKKQIQQTWRCILNFFGKLFTFIKKHFLYLNLFLFVLILLLYLFGLLEVDITSILLTILFVILLFLVSDKLAVCTSKTLRKHLSKSEVGIGVLTIFVLLLIYGLLGWSLFSIGNEVMENSSSIYLLDQLLSSVEGFIKKLFSLVSNYISINDFNNVILGIISLFIFVSFVDKKPTTNLGGWVFNQEMKLEILFIFIIFISQLLAFNIGGKEIKLGAVFLFISFFIFIIFKTLKYLLYFKKEPDKRCLEYIRIQNDEYHEEDGDDLYKSKIIKFWEIYFDKNEITTKKDEYLEQYTRSLELFKQKESWKGLNKLIKAYNEKVREGRYGLDDMDKEPTYFFLRFYEEHRQKDLSGSVHRNIKTNLEGKIENGVIGNNWRIWLRAFSKLMTDDNEFIEEIRDSSENIKLTVVGVFLDSLMKFNFDDKGRGAGIMSDFLDKKTNFEFLYDWTEKTVDNKDGLSCKKVKSLKNIYKTFCDDHLINKGIDYDCDYRYFLFLTLLENLVKTSKSLYNLKYFGSSEDCDNNPTPYMGLDLFLNCFGEIEEDVANKEDKRNIKCRLKYRRKVSENEEIKRSFQKIKKRISESNGLSNPRLDCIDNIVDLVITQIE